MMMIQKKSSMILLFFVLLALTVVVSSASSYEPEYSFLRASRLLKGKPVKEEDDSSGGGGGNCHDCSCFTCDSNSVVENGDGTISVQVKHCKEGGTISWMCCVGIDGAEGGCDVDKTCTPEDENHAKCNTIDHSNGLTITMPDTATKFTVNTHDGQTGGDADMINSRCGGNGNQGGGCKNPTAHCLVEYDLLTDCGYSGGSSSGGGSGTPDSSAQTEEVTPPLGSDDTPAPTGEPTIAASDEPSTVPTKAPVVADTPSPTGEPSIAASDEPSTVPTKAPVVADTSSPTGEPTILASDEPSTVPTKAPVDADTPSPTGEPSIAASDEPSTVPTKAPVVADTSSPTGEPTILASDEPSTVPTKAPVDADTPSPTSEPSIAASDEPSTVPTKAPAVADTPSPTSEPSVGASDMPSSVPTKAPVTSPDVSPRSVPNNGNYAPECPGAESVLLLDQRGSTPLPDLSNLPIKIVSRDTSEVTFEVVNTFTTGASVSDLDYVYVSYYNENRESTCVEHLAWPVSAKSSTFTSVCGSNNKATMVQLYVADPIAVLAGDDATIERCCHGPENIPTVHYMFEIRCECPEMTS